MVVVHMDGVSHNQCVVGTNHIQSELHGWAINPITTRIQTEGQK